MIRLSLVFILFVGLYVAFAVISDYDSQINFMVENYQVETTAFTVAAIIAISAIIILVALKIITSIISIPFWLKNLYYGTQKKRILRKNFLLIGDFLIGKKNIDVNNHLKYAEGESRSVMLIIQAEKEADYAKRIGLLRALLEDKKYGCYAAKNLAIIYADNQHYHDALQYGLKAFNLDEDDCELMLVLAKIYAHLEMWEKLVYLISKLKRADEKLLESNGEIVAGYYYEAAKDMLGKGNDDEAMRYLESALWIKPDHMPSLTLFMELNVNLGNIDSLMKVLFAAFSFKPSFEVAIMIAKTSQSVDLNDIYRKLAKLYNPQEYTGLYIAIAVAFSLPEQASKLTEKIMPEKS